MTLDYYWRQKTAQKNIANALKLLKTTKFVFPNYICFVVLFTLFILPLLQNPFFQEA